MLIVIVLTICLGWCLAAMAAALVIGASINRRDAESDCSDVAIAAPSATTGIRSDMPVHIVGA